ncbi:MAG: hypothetical protein ACK5WA_02115 [Alphaproteobacteria bacterium]
MGETLAEAAWRLAFGDLTPEHVFALREGAAWRLLPGASAGRYAHLLSIADLDAFLRTDAARHPRVTMADGGRQGSAAIPPDEYLQTEGSRVDLPRLLARYDAGGQPGCLAIP